MQSGFPFQPRASNQNPPAGTVSIAVTAALQTLNLPAPAPYETETSGRFICDGTQEIFWAYGNQAGLSTANGVPMLAGTIETFSIPPGISQVSVIAGNVGSTLRITVGDGM